MTIQKIIGENGVLPRPCGNGQCPAVLLADNGDLFVQGFIPSPAEGAALTAPTGESFVRMPRPTFERIVQQLLAS